MKIASLIHSTADHSLECTLCIRHCYTGANGRMALREWFNFSDLQFPHLSNEGHAIQLVWLLRKWRQRRTPTVGAQWVLVPPSPSDHICSLGTLEKWHSPTQFHCMSPCLLSCCGAECLEAHRRHFLAIFVHLWCVARCCSQHLLAEHRLTKSRHALLKSWGPSCCVELNLEIKWSPKADRTVILSK